MILNGTIRLLLGFVPQPNLPGSSLFGACHGPAETQCELGLSMGYRAEK